MRPLRAQRKYSSLLIAISVLSLGFLPPRALASELCANLWRSADSPLRAESLTTPRLELEILGPARIDDTLAIWSHPNVQFFFAPTRALSRFSVSEILTDSRVHHFGIYQRGPFPAKNLIGTVSLRNDGFLSIAIHPAYSRQGIATEALERVIQLAFDQLNVETLDAHVLVGNEASVALFKKLGFYEGRSGNANSRRFILSRMGLFR